MKYPVHILNIILLLAGLVSAESHRYTPSAAISEAISGNLELRAARHRIAVAEAELKWAGKLDNPELELTGSTDQWGLNDNESLMEVAISQEFPLTNRLKRERNLSEVDVALAKAEVRVREWELAGKVRTGTVNALAMHRQIRLREDLRDVLSQLVKSVEEAYARAEASQLDVTEAKLEVQMQTKAIRQLESELQLANAELRGLMSLPPDTQVRILGNLASPNGDCRVQPTTEVVARRPDLQLSVLEERRAEAAVALAKSRRWEDIAVKLFMERETAVDEPEGTERNTFLGLSLSVPLPIRTPKARLTDAPKEELATAQASTTAVAAAIHNEIATANEEVVSRRRIYEQASGEILTLARENVDQVKQAWLNGNASILRLQRAQERALSLEEDSIEALHQYHLACARVRKAAAQDVSAEIPPDPATP